MSDLAHVNLSDAQATEYRLCTDDLLINRTNSYELVGKTAIFDLPGDIVFASYLVRFQLDKTQVFPRFVHYFLNSETGKILLQGFATKGVSQANLNPTTLKKRLPIPLPPLAEQRKIAAILSTWDEAITLTERLIEALRQRKQALMQLLLTGEVRFKEFEGEDWSEVEIGSFLKESRISGGDGATAKKITVRLYGKGVYPKDDARTGSENTRYYVRKAGQFIYSKLDFLNGAFGIIPDNMDGYESTLDLPTFDISPSINALFFLNYVSREDFYKNFWGQAKGGRKARRVAPSELLETSIDLPLPPEQNKIAEAIHFMERHIDICIQYHNALVGQKRALMQQLLSGAIRVQVDK